MSAEVVVVCPLWRRTSVVERMLRTLFNTTDQARCLLVVSEHDKATRVVADDLYVRYGHADVLIVPGPGGEPGDYARKINAGYRASDEPFIFTGADDIAFMSGWYEAARAAMGTWWCDGCKSEHPGDVGVVGTTDEANPRVMAGLHSTHTLVARWYADMGGSIDQREMIYHEGYAHEYCDDELVQTAMVRQAWAFAADAHVPHLHPINPALGVPDDETYQRGRALTQRSRSLYRRRVALWRPYG